MPDATKEELLFFLGQCALASHPQGLLESAPPEVPFTPNVFVACEYYFDKIKVTDKMVLEYVEAALDVGSITYEQFLTVTDAIRDAGIYEYNLNSYKTMGELQNDCVKRYKAYVRAIEILK